MAKSTKPIRHYVVDICVTKWITRRVTARTDAEAERKAINSVVSKLHKINRKEIEANPIER